MKHQNDFDDGWARKRARMSIRNLKKIIEVRGLSVLILGCGMGYECDEWKKLGNYVEACDINPKYISHTKRYAHKTFSCDLMKKIPKPDRKFDVVYCSETFEHLLSPQPFMNECRRILKDRGFLIMTTDNPSNIKNIIRMVFQNSSYFHSAGHYQFYSPKDMKNLLEVNGFNVLKIKNMGILGAVYMVIARRNAMINTLNDLKTKRNDYEKSNS